MGQQVFCHGLQGLEGAQVPFVSSVLYCWPGLPPTSGQWWSGASPPWFWALTWTVLGPDMSHSGNIRWGIGSMSRFHWRLRSVATLRHKNLQKMQNLFSILFYHWPGRTVYPCIYYLRFQTPARFCRLPSYIQNCKDNKQAQARYCWKILTVRQKT
jgi:hypothetical protein